MSMRTPLSAVRTRIEMSSRKPITNVRATASMRPSRSPPRGETLSRTRQPRRGDGDETRRVGKIGGDVGNRRQRRAAGEFERRPAHKQETDRGGGDRAGQPAPSLGPDHDEGGGGDEQPKERDPEA